MAPATKAPTMDGVRSIEELRQILESIGPDARRIDELVTEETARSSSRVRFLQILQEAFDAAVEEDDEERLEKPERENPTAPDSGRNHPEDPEARVREFVELALEEESGAETLALYDHAEKIAPDLIGKLTLRQFNARYVLPVKRDRKRKPKRASPDPQTRVDQEEGAPPEIRMVDPEDLVPWEGLNPRRDFGEEGMAELEASIRQDGVRLPLLVHDAGERGLWIVAGERRWRAARSAGVKVPAMVSYYTLEEALRVALVENVQRRDLSPVEEARGFQRYLHESGRSQRDLAQEIGRSQGWVGNRIRLLKLPEQILQLIESGRLAHSVARDLILPFASLNDEKLWARLAEKVAERLESHQKELTEDRVQEVVREVAGKASKPLRYKDHSTSRVWSVDGYSGEQDDPTAGSHQKCSCGAPKWPWNHGGAKVRCFDAKWWKAAAKKVADARKAREEKRNQQPEGEPVEIEWPDRSVPLDGRDMRELGVHYRDAVEFDFQWAVPDVALLPVEHLYWRSGYDGTPVLLCLDNAAGRAANKAGSETLERLTDEAKAARAEQDREAVSTGGKLVADLWVDGLGIALQSPLQLYGALEEVTGTAMPGGRGSVGWAREHADPRSLEVALMVIGLRHGRGEVLDNGRDLFPGTVQEEYCRKQRQALRDAGFPDPVVPEEEGEGDDAPGS